MNQDTKIKANKPKEKILAPTQNETKTRVPFHKQKNKQTGVPFLQSNSKFKIIHQGKTKKKDEKKNSRKALERKKLDRKDKTKTKDGPVEKEQKKGERQGGLTMAKQLRKKIQRQKSKHPKTFRHSSI